MYNSIVDILCICTSYFLSGLVSISCLSRHSIYPDFQVQEYGDNSPVILSPSVLREQTDYTILMINTSFYSLSISNAVHHNGSFYRCFAHVGQGSEFSRWLQLVISKFSTVFNVISMNIQYSTSTIPVLYNIIIMLNIYYIECNIPEVEIK